MCYRILHRLVQLPLDSTGASWYACYTCLVKDSIIHSGPFLKNSFGSQDRKAKPPAKRGPSPQFRHQGLGFRLSALRIERGCFIVAVSLREVAVAVALAAVMAA